MRNNEISIAKAMSMNRHERRKLGKLNNTKIYGSEEPIVKYPKGRRSRTKKGRNA